MGTFVAVALTFFAANIFTQRAMAQIDAASDDIAFNSAPSIQRLSGVRTTVRHAEFLLDAAVSSGTPKNRAAVAPALAHLADEANAYLLLRTFPGEKDLWRELNESIAGFDGTVHRTLAQLDAGSLQTARSDLPAVAAAADRVARISSEAIDSMHGTAETSPCVSSRSGMTPPGSATC